MVEAALLLEVDENPHDEGLEGVFVQGPEAADLVSEGFQGFRGYPVQQVRVGMGHGGAGLFEGPADPAAEPVFGVDFPFDAALDVPQQIGVGRELAGPLQGFVIGQPHHVGGDERGDEGAVVHPVRPVADKAGRDLLEGASVAVRLNVLLDGAAEVEPVGAAGEKPRPVGRVLHGIGKGEQLFVVVEGGGVQLGDHHAGEAGGPGTENGQPVVGVAVGAVAGSHLPAVAPLDAGVGDKDPDEGGFAAVGAFTGGKLGCEMDAVAAQPVELSVGLDLPQVGVLGEDEDRLGVVAEKRHVEGLEVGDHGVVVLAFDPGPSHAAALPAMDQGQVPLQLPVIQIVREPEFGCGGDFSGHPAQLPEPEMVPDLEKRLSMAVGVFHGRRHQGQDAGQDVDFVIVGGGSEFGGDPFQVRQDVGVAADPAGENFEQVLEKEMALEFVAQVGAPGAVGDVRDWNGVVEPEGVLGRDVVGEGGVFFGVQFVRLFQGDDLHLGDEAFFEERAGRDAVFRYHGVGVQGLAEDFGCIVQEAAVSGFVPQGRRGADAAEMALRGFQPGLEPPQEAGQVGALGAVEGVEFIHHQVPEGFGVVLRPQGEIPGADQEVVEHLVVGEQDVGRAVAQGVLVADDGRFGHAVKGIFFALAHEQTGGDGLFQVGVLVDGFGDAGGLIRRQGVHGVDEDGLDAGVAPVAMAMVQDGVEKAFGFARSGAGGDEGGSGVGAGKAVEGAFLVAVRDVWEGEVWEVGGGGVAYLERELEVEEGAFEDGFGFG